MRARMIHVLGLATAVAALVTGLAVPAASAGAVAPAKTTAPVAHAATGCRHHLMAYVTTSAFGGSGIVGTATVTPVDTATGATLKPIPLSGDPWAIVVTPDGKRAYVADQSWPTSSVTVISTRTGAVLKKIPVPGPQGMMTVIGVTPNGKTVYVSFGATVVPIRTADNKTLTPINTGVAVTGMIFTPDSRKLYVNSWNGEVVPISTRTSTMGMPIMLPTYELGIASGLAITPNGRTLYAASGTTLTPISTATDKAGQPITFAEQIMGVAISKDGRIAYVANLGEYAGPGTLYPVRLATRTILTPIKLPGTASYMVFTPNGKTLYAAEQLAGTVTAIRTAGRTVLANIKVPPMAGIAVTPDGRTVYVLADSLIPIRVGASKAGPAIPLSGPAEAIAFFRA
jgi:hypothetical protein